MSDSWAEIDANSRQGLTAASSSDGTTIVRLWANPSTHRLLTTNSTLSGPVSSTDTAIVRWNGTTGLTVEDSSITFDTAKTGVASSTLFTQTATKTVANTGSETALNSTGVGSLTLPASSLIAGRTIKITAAGFHSSTGNPTIRLKVKFGATIILDTGAVTSGNSTNAFWEVRGFITCYTTGGTGTVWGQGFYSESGGGANSFSMVNTSAITIDTTATQAITLTAQWGTADPGNTTTCTNLIVEDIN